MTERPTKPLEPGARSAPHRHGGAEEFPIIEGEPINSGGTVCRPTGPARPGPGTADDSAAP